MIERNNENTLSPFQENTCTSDIIFSRLKLHQNVLFNKHTVCSGRNLAWRIAVRLDMVHEICYLTVINCVDLPQQLPNLNIVSFPSQHWVVLVEYLDLSLPAQ